jgi:hypothetical protein
MDSLLEKTNTAGEFTLDQFVPGHLQHEFMATVIEPGYAMTSLYRGMDDADRDAPVNLIVESTDPITFTVTDAQSQPIEGVVLSPSQRVTNEGVLHLNYPINRMVVTATTDADGKATMTAWKPTEQGRVFYEVGGKTGTLEFQLTSVPNITLQIPPNHNP